MDQVIDSAGMLVGDRVKLPAPKWANSAGIPTVNQEIYRQAGEYCRAFEGNPKPQFQIDGNDDNKGYWLERIR